MPFRMKNTDVLFISLVPAGANKRQVVFKFAGEKNAAPSASSGQAFDRDFEVRKADDARQMVYGIAYPVGDKDNTDTQQDFAEKDEVEQMAHNFMAKGRAAYGVDRDHSYRALDKVFVAESWIVRKGDPLFGNPEDVDAWAVGIKITDKALYDELKKTGYRGLSIAGTCEREEVAKENKTAGDNGGWLARWRRLLRKEEAVEETKKALEEMAAAVKSLTERLDKLEKGAAPAQEGAKQAHSAGSGQAAQTVVKIDGGELLKELKGLTERLEKLEKGDAPAAKDDAAKGADAAPADAGKAAADELTKSIKTLSERVEKLEKASPGSAQTDPAAKKSGLGLL